MAGYNAVVGYAWWVEYRRDGMYDLLNHVGNQGVPLSFFGAVENHNTPRAAGREGGTQYSKYAFLVNTMLPRAIPFIHSGQELGEVVPVNTGLDFSNDDLERIKGNKLALFDLCGYQWDGQHEMLEFMQSVLKVRKDYSTAAMDKNTDSFGLLETGHKDVICFLRKSDNQHILVLFNRDLNTSISGNIKLDWCLPSNVGYLRNYVQLSGDHNWSVKSGNLAYKLNPGDCALFAW
jgi:glycosidase